MTSLMNGYDGISSDMNPLRAACEKGDALELQNCLSQCTQDVNFMSGDRYGNTLLHLAVVSRSPDCIKLLLKRNAKVDVKNMDMNTPLHFAAKVGSSECVELLLSAGAKPCERNNSNNTPLHYAAESSSSGIIKLILKDIGDKSYSLDGEVNSSNLDKRTPLHLAALVGCPDCIRVLVENKAELSMGDGRGNTPLHYAAMSGSPDCVKQLVEVGANLLFMNKDKYTPIYLIMNNMPHGDILLRDVFNGNIEVRKLDNGKEELKLNLKIVCPKSKNRIALCNRLYTSHRHKKLLLLHPLLKTLILLEWEKSKYIIWYRFTVYLLYLLVLTVFVSSEPDTVHSLITRVSSGFLSGHVTLFCFPYLLPGQYSWFRRITKTSLTIIPPLLALVAVCIPYNREWCGISFLLSWLSLPFYSSAISYISYQAGMFIYVTKEIFKHSVILLFVLVGFSLTFYVLYYEKNSESFDDFWHTFLYTILVLLQGDNLGDFPIFGGNRTSNVTSEDGYITFVTEALSSMRFASIVASVLFVVVVIIALLNMLVALAVRGGDELLEYGQVYHLWSQAQLLYEWNEVKRFLHRSFRNRDAQDFEFSYDQDVINIGEKEIPLALRHELSVAAKYKNEKKKKIKLTIGAIEALVEDKMSKLISEFQDILKTSAENKL